MEGDDEVGVGTIAPQAVTAAAGAASSLGGGIASGGATADSSIQVEEPEYGALGSGDVAVSAAKWRDAWACSEPVAERWSRPRHRSQLKKCEA